ncbi:Uncharacterised protein [Pseudomonas aeruginosa]|nr:Uncharacterised protein [Pseudomonas aeruginosa]
MEAVSVSQHLAALFESHRIDCVVHGEWVAPAGRLPAIRATWYAGEKTGRLDVDVLLEDERQLQEAFAGIGSGEDGLQDALRNFASNSFHVLLSALWGQAEEDQVMVETWEIGERRFEVHIGNLGLRGAEGKAPPLPAGLFPSIERAIRTEPLDARLHWFRHFFCAFGNQRTVEALFDNQPWEAGMQNLAALDWQDSQGYYSVRNFLHAQAAGVGRRVALRRVRPLPHDQHCDDPAAPGRRDDAESFFIGKRRHDFQMRRAQD